MARNKPKNGFKSSGIDFSFLGSRDETAEERTVESRRKLREIMDSQIEDFLKKGGKITQVSPNTVSEKTDKVNSKSKYGNRPI